MLEGRQLKALPVLTLIVGNIVFPLVGVGLFGWSPADVIFAFWTETLVVGIYTFIRFWTIPKEKAIFTMKRNGVDKQLTGASARISSSAFFLVHFGVFMFVHLAFIIELFGDGRTAAAPVAMFTGFLVLLASHGTSFFVNDIIRKEVPKKGINALFGRPYLRVVPVHVALLMGAELVGGVGASAALPALLVLLGLKLPVDLLVHVHEHKKKVG